MDVQSGSNKQEHKVSLGLEINIKTKNTRNTKTCLPITTIEYQRIQAQKEAKKKRAEIEEEKRIRKLNKKRIAENLKLKEQAKQKQLEQERIKIEEVETAKNCGLCRVKTPVLPKKLQNCDYTAIKQNQTTEKQDM